VQEQSDFEIAQRRIAERQSKRNIFHIWVAALILLILFGLVSGGEVCGALFPIGGIIGLIAFAKGIELYYESPRRQTSREQIEEEMSWLFGENWQEVVGTQSYAFAQSRIRQRRKERWLWVVHTLLFVPASLAIASIGLMGVRYGEPGVAAILVLNMIWLLFFLRHAVKAFPTRGMLASRERKVGEALLLELQSMRPEKLKRKEKPDDASRYAIGDDGELIERTEDSDQLDDKPRRQTQ
jgi:hypothetical protein